MLQHATATVPRASDIRAVRTIAGSVNRVLVGGEAAVTVKVTKLQPVCRDYRRRSRRQGDLALARLGYGRRSISDCERRG